MMRYLARFLRDATGAAATTMIVGFLVVALIASALVPTIVTTLVGADQTSWPDLLVTVWDFLPVIIGIAILLVFLRKVGIGGDAT